MSGILEVQAYPRLVEVDEQLKLVVTFGERQHFRQAAQLFGGHMIENKHRLSLGRRQLAKTRGHVLGTVKVNGWELLGVLNEVIFFLVVGFKILNSDKWKGIKFLFNSLRRIYATVKQPSLVQIMACRLVGAKPLSAPLLEYCEYTVECRYNAVQHNMLFHTSLHWLARNANQTSNSQKTLHISPSRASCGVSLVRIWEKIDRVITALHCI